MSFLINMVCENFSKNYEIQIKSHKIKPCYGKVLLTLKTSTIIAGESPYVYIFLLPKSGYFCDVLRKKHFRG